jgi:hypothetical protein
MDEAPLNDILGSSASESKPAVTYRSRQRARTYMPPIRVELGEPTLASESASELV